MSIFDCADSYLCKLALSHCSSKGEDVFAGNLKFKCLLGKLQLAQTQNVNHYPMTQEDLKPAAQSKTQYRDEDFCTRIVKF